MSACMWVHAGVVRCQIFEHSMFRENNQQEGEIDSLRKEVEPVSLNTCVILIKIHVIEKTHKLGIKDEWKHFLFMSGKSTWSIEPQVLKCI